MDNLEGLSERDKAVLRSIFDPTATIAEVAENGDTFPEKDPAYSGRNIWMEFPRIYYQLFNKTVATPELDVTSKVAKAICPITDEEKLSATLIAEGVRLAEAGQLDQALELMTKAVAAAPHRPEAYNDRAQLLRLMQKDDEAECDISRALSLTETDVQPRARALALCQRGVLLRKAGNDDGARAAFAEAAKLGSGFAKKQVVELNPYAALCNQMLSQVMRGDQNIRL